MLEGLTISGYRPGAIADVLKLHMTYYQVNWNFGLKFETKVAGELAEFLDRYRSGTDLFLTVYTADGACVGSISLDCQNSEERGAHVRWFIVDPGFTGCGIGRRLMTKVTDHSDRHRIARSYLTTFEGLHAARKIYESFGYRLTEERDVDQWNGGVKEQLFVRDISLF